MIKRAAQIAGRNVDDGEPIPTNEWIRNILLDNIDVKKAMKELGVQLEHPMGRGMYDREKAERRRLRKAARAKSQAEVGLC